MMRRLGGVVGLGYVLVAGIAAFALLFSSAHGAQDLSREAAIVQRSEGVLGAAVVARASLGEALLLTDAARVGVATESAAQGAREKADRALDALADRLEGLSEVVEGPTPDGSDLLAAGREVTGLLSGAEVKQGTTVLEERFQPAHDRLVDAVGEHRDAATARLATAESSAGLLIGLARFAVAFALPVLALLGYRELMRRRVRESELIAMLGAERELSRAKDEFIANISHELRTPLTSIYGFSRVLEDEGFEDPETALDLVNLIISESSELSRMVDDLLTAARADAGVLSFEIEDVEIRSELEEVVAPFSRMGPAIELDCEPTMVRADPLRLRQVVRNLISNSRRHGGPRVRVVGRSLPEGMFACTVADDGPGVHPDVEDRLFQRFSHRGREALLAGGLGIGLSIARMLCEQMGGRIEYERRRGETLFTVLIPLAGREADLAPAQAIGADRNLDHLLEESVIDLSQLESMDGGLVGEPREGGGW